MNSAAIANEFPRPQEVEQIPPRGMELTITATTAECAAVAKRLSLLELPALSATLTIDRIDGKTFRVRGQFTAQAVQQCSVTLEPVPVTVQEPVSGLFMPEKLIAAYDGVIEDPLDEVVEPILDGVIDLGELVVQHLALALDPYPRHPDAAIAAAAPKAAANDTPKNNPFAVLAGLVKEKK